MPIILLSWHALKLRPIRYGCEPFGTRNQCALDAPLTVEDETLKCVDSFTYLGSVISKNESAHKDIKKRRNAFAEPGMLLLI